MTPKMLAMFFLPPMFTDQMNGPQLCKSLGSFLPPTFTITQRRGLPEETPSSLFQGMNETALVRAYPETHR